MQNKVFYLLTIMLMLIVSSCSKDDEKEKYPNLIHPTTETLDGTTWYQKSGTTTYLVSFKGNKIGMSGRYGRDFGTYTISDKQMHVTVEENKVSKTYNLSCMMFLISDSGDYQLFLVGKPNKEDTPIYLPTGNYYKYPGKSPFF